MTEQVSLDVSEKISEKFSGKIQKDQREGYEGFIVNNEILLDLCFYLRDDLGFDFLSSLTGVDYYPDNLMEVVYHLYNSANYGKIVFKVQTTRDEASVASIVPVYQGADLQEREAWDLLGIKFVGHPDLRRVLMWEGFDGHPLRKDWHEAYFEEEIKPLKSRYPEGTSISAEDKTDFKDNIKFPADFDLEQWTPQGDEPLYDSLLGVHKSEKGLKTERIIVNLGPQHPSTHGVFRMVVVLDGETIVDLKPVMGYLHRNHEKIGERNTYIQNMPFTDRLDYISSMSNNFGYALAVEKLMGIKPTERAEYIRVIMAELTRISSHVMNIGFLLNDLGAFFTPALYALKE
ncbi:MAG: NADH-quinone oxidoreductase subunit C, partial [Anaerolineae bacterium]|nr:NADH-quinone oxidoreductase subunit C [Anaerolineae bacterium]